MKRILALILMLTLAVFCFASCASISKFEDKLEDADYEVEVTDDEDEIEAFAEMYDIDYEDYKIKEILAAANEDYDTVYIIKCGMFKAGKLVKELEDALEDMEDIKIEKKGSCVLVGSKGAIKDATK